MRKLVYIGIVISLSLGSLGSAQAVERAAPNWSAAQKRLKGAGFKNSFIRALKESYELEDFRDVTELNLLLFLRKVDHHAVQVTDEASDKVRAFMKVNRVTLDLAERKYQVAAPVIASLLWMESRYGQNLGRFHLASVFVSLLQVDRPEVLRDLKKYGVSRFTENASKKDLKKITERSKTKSKWAMGELKAIERIYREKGEDVLHFRGSFAGAFGMPQFLPSSYSRWAKAAKVAKTSRAKRDGSGSPDLTKPDDAIHSVANYLKANGWREKRKRTHVVALMNYNNSLDYANAILKLAKKVTEVHGLASSSPSPTEPSPMPAKEMMDMDSPSIKEGSDN
jgi:membrane-bound lytic murein transglycosylase B